ncbi:hypothetical protein B0J12DRAFT_652492 [Macrophomina phaseolina]|uniref:Cell division cycle protein 123 n=1 Tax=Macrophomina phaseolina TaxID=35725 RepID=A0ABQ8GKY3_9PEZI|nr:hypothetical protein B0J12DRAFT_652492 [Macrophomina phaseolina]
MDGRREFRVFVPPAMGSSRSESGEGTRGLRIAAISQYRWHEAYRAPWDGVGVEKTARRLVEGTERLLREIVAFAARLNWEGEGDDIVKETLLHVLEERGFVFDVVAMGEGAGGGGDDDGDYEVQLVELNPFGATTGCGSLLFHWVKDARVLYGLEEED